MINGVLHFFCETSLFFFFLSRLQGKMSYLPNESDCADHQEVDALTTTTDEARVNDDAAAKAYEEGDECDPDAPLLDPETATAEDLVDEDTREAYGNLRATIDFVANSQEDQRILLLQQAEIKDFLEHADDAKIEYFNVAYWTGEAKKVWSERANEDSHAGLGDAMDTSASRPNAVRLFPSAIAAQAQEKLRERLKEDHALDDRDELRKRHPLLFNRVVRDESRRAVFSNAMEARRTYQSRMENPTSLPLLLQQHAAAQQQQQQGDTNSGLSRVADSCASTSLHAIKAPSSKGKAFASLPQYIRHDVQSVVSETQANKFPNKRQAPPLLEAADSHMQEAERIVDTATGSPSATCPSEDAKPPSLQDMLAQQRQQLQDLVLREETQYRPLLASYFAYDEAVRQKLDRMSELFAASSSTTA